MAATYGHGSAKVLEFGHKDALFARILADAQEAVRREPDLAGFLFANVLHHETLERAIIHRVAARLDHPDLGADAIVHAYSGVIAADPSIVEAFRADILAVFDRDPACTRLIEPLLYFKGFHALQTHRLAHALLKSGRRDFALYLQSRASAVFQVDINPGAKFGKGVFLDHARVFVEGLLANPKPAFAHSDVLILVTRFHRLESHSTRATSAPVARGCSPRRSWNGALCATPETRLEKR